ncbi:MAG: tetratricopeptide repeat protein [Candidatus Lokiarchaeota archaeon]|nr:tetratricopeptide repeat protein [Candidatus Lokiarchaeota archaeon]
MVEVKQVKLNLQELFLRNDLTFLVGAGCSIDPPSGLPSGGKMMDAIIDYTCDESEIDNIRKLKGLRFEALVEIVRYTLDKQLHLIDYFGECKIPNLQHFFLAEMIKRGNLVLTTNFDFLIEHALIRSGVQKENIIPVITEDDFRKYKDPEDLFNKGKKAIYKIHGSTKNIITGKSTRSSLIATIQAFGSNKEGENVFQLEHFKRPLFINSTNERSLVIMGYSGSDDFDIVPTLKILEGIKNIYWINYVYHDKGREKIFEILKDTDPNFDEYKKVNQILVEIKRMNTIEHIYRIDVNTSRLVKDLIKAEYEVSEREFKIKPLEWIESNITSPSKIIKLQIPYKIYQSLNIFEPALRCCEETLKIAEEMNNQSWKRVALNNIGTINGIRGKYSEALKQYLKVLEITEHLGDLNEKFTIIDNIGAVYRKMGNYRLALKYHQKALNIMTN